MSRILLVLDSSRAERWHHLEPYGSWFWGVLHFPNEMADEAQCDAKGVACLTSEDLPQVCIDAVEASEPKCATCGCSQPQCSSMANSTLYWGFALHVFEPHVRVALVLRWLRNRSMMPSRPRWLQLLQARAAHPAHHVRGVLYAHMDLWVLPFAVAPALSLDRVWLLHGRVKAGSGCMTAAEVISTDGWWCGASSSGWAAMRMVERQGLLPAMWSEKMLCPGWSDLFYVPTFLANQYNSLARVFRTHHVVNEIATHTILRLLASSNGDQVEYLRCAGGALAHVAPEEIGAYPCGHRLDFNDNAQATALTAALLRHQDARSNVSRQPCNL